MSHGTVETRSGWHGLGRRVANVAIACCITYVLASIAHSYYVVGKIEQLGVSVPLADQLRMMLGDLVGLYAYSVVIVVGLVIGWAVMALVRRLRKISRWIVYPLGGFLAMGTIMVAVSLLLPVTAIAPARHLPGIAGQCAAGFLGGVAFAWLQDITQWQERRPTD